MMTNQYRFPTFHFYPVELTNEVQRLEKKYKQADRVSVAMTKIKLPKLLKEIRALRNDLSEIIDFARGLTKLEINILATEYPYKKEDKDILRKITIILKEKYNRIVGRRFWIHFQAEPYDEFIVDMLNYVMHHESENFLGLNSNIRKKYKTIFMKEDEIIPGIALEIGKEKRVVESSFADWKIRKDSSLAHELWIHILQSFIGDKGFLDVQDIRVVEDKLENINLQIYKKIIHKYLMSFEITQYNSVLLKQVIARLNDPRENLHRWQGMSQQSVDRVKKWLIRQELYKFLDNDRFNYWEKYLNKVNDLKVVKEPPVAAIYFDQFVVVEFANVGNAAYFYELEGFKKHIEPRVKSFIPESYLKNRYASYFIKKLNHAGHWPSRFDGYMANYLRGYFRYKH